MTNYLEEQLLKAVVNGETFTGPTALYVALFTSNPTETGTAGNEVSDSSYSRQLVTFTQPIDSTVSNTELIEFPPATTPYGTVTHIGIFDNSTGGNLLFYKELANPIEVLEGTGIRIATGELTISLD